MRHVGTIKTWKDDKGFGFITPRGGGEPVFVHIKSFEDRSDRPTEGCVVTYELVFDDQRRPQAKSVAYESPERASPSTESNLSPAIFGSVLGFSAMVIWCVVQRLSPLVPLAIAVLCALTFVTYAYDKSRAQDGGWRVSEKTLLILGLVGGWPGAILAQHVFRHKLRKPDFMIVFWLTVFVNLVGLVLLTSPAGNKLLNLLE